MTALQLVDSSETVIFDLDDPTGAANPHSLKTRLRMLDLGAPNRDASLFSPTSVPGAIRTRVKHGAVIGQAVLSIESTSSDLLLAGHGELARLLEREGIALRLQANGQTSARLIDVADASLASLLRGGDREGFFRFTQFYDDELGITFVRQPFLRGAELDSDTNKLKNPFLILEGATTDRPAEWTTGAQFSSSTINDSDNSLSVTLTGSGVGYTQDFVATATGTWTLSGEIAVAGAILRLENVTAATSDDSTAAASSSFTRVADASISATSGDTLRVHLRGNAASTFKFRRIQLETGASSSFVGSTEIVPNDPAGQTVFAPTTPITAGAVTAGGSVTTGSHAWYATFVTAAGETPVGPKSNVITAGAANATVPLSDIPLGTSEVTARKIYRTVAGDTGNPKLLTTINDNTTTVFSDTIADGSLGADAPTANTTAEKVSRVHLVYNGGDADAPFIFEAKGDSGAQVQAIGYATLSALEDGGKSLSRRLNGPKVIQCEDFNVTGDFGAGGVVVGVDTADGDASGGRAVVYSSFNQTDYRQLLRIELTDTDALEGFRGASDVRLRLKVSAASDIEFQMRSADSLEEPASIRALPVRHNTNIDGLATFGYVEITLGRIALPTEGTLEGLTIEIWARHKAGATPNLSLDCLVLVPTEKASLISLPYTARALVAENTANATLGNKLGALKWRVTWRYSVQSPSATYEAGFRVRRDSVSGTIIVQRDMAHANDITNATVAMEFTALSGVSYFTSTAAAVGTGTLTIHEVIVEKVCILESGQALITDPRLGIDRAYQQSATGAFMCSAVGAPIPFWLPPGLTAVYVEVMEPRIGGQYSELSSNLRRLTTVSHRYGPRFPA